MGARGRLAVSVNGERVAGVSLAMVTTIIARAALPRALGFAGPMRGAFDGLNGHEGPL